MIWRVKIHILAVLLLVGCSSGGNYYSDAEYYYELSREYEDKMEQAHSDINECINQINDAIDTGDDSYLDDAITTLEGIDLSH